MTDGANVAVVIAAAGSGSRFGSELPKQFCELNGLPVAFHAIERLRSFLPKARIITVLAPGKLDYWADLCRRHNILPTLTASGGDTRWQSVKNALELIDSTTDIVMVHDAARPIVMERVVRQLSQAVAAGADGALPVVPMTDSLRMDCEAGGSLAVDRSKFHAVQTPQAFNLAKLKEAYQIPWRPEFTDDASVMEAAGFGNIELVEGDEATLKITRPVDIELAVLYLERSNEHTA
ncbi:MAG: 2-C-methyl-D-erythritol 4-phosphate cytidylyltransferase [Firmicutes bacterium]|nr:2-C-methyl-D-erythritol 4-phosphate cytidylyltransferase [Bacillota bacterium]MCM1401323.1 2-C-methyl-D-erythritol 4-phosphate cytidylyltransferase [Bacteroides sp.]MCM1477276.1 2-C-methyl-D-erythritol 4-phosphate cytidylyltransferase [Bacteroides sp.]